MPNHSIPTEKQPPHVGMRVQTIQSIDRFPFFLLAETRLTGTVTLVEEDVILIKMDQPIPGCETWNNEIQLVSDELGDYGNGVVIASMLDLFAYYFAPETVTTENENA